LEKLFQ